MDIRVEWRQSIDSSGDCYPPEIIVKSLLGQFHKIL